MRFGGNVRLRPSSREKAETVIRVDDGDGGSGGRKWGS